ncbi:MAG: MurR/RpiR family transcriptional regulator [Oenococcus sp.]|uniref:RpiR family sialic acid utilization regulator n=1 Tax=Oenococcus kitaharae DSM 17330 TaxID=1045004 RepID=G9WJD1_9LACO|nr:MurR/RpiR family transcriptional regulator [Oenococcus kitaharae]EHN58737.1 RpiR family sialic acid utilization regulator [Oenococcus kitaharae DSM 17330]OEY81911.1 RpiR family transcriptional regulator [Oenococcus kitaharae]OEY82301.1 RpiR family transcriptional regulator [Oenococcus kitaharae]OEY82527.1 RpiR family transcriptional regulator [Oenococcus kitaharae]
MLLIDRLKNQDKLTATEKKIADFVLENLTDISSMSIEKLAKQSYTSHSAIVRFSKKMGFDGYKEFRIAVLKTIQARLYNLENVDTNFPFTATDSPLIIAKKLADLTVNTIKRSYAQLSEDQLIQAVDMLTKAERIFLFAEGDSQIRARSFQNKLVKVNKFLILGEEYADEDWTAANMTPKDCALFISYGGKVRQYGRMLNYLTDQKVPTIVITGNPKSKIIETASLALVIVQDEYDFLKVSTFSSQISFEYLLDTLFSILFAREYNQNMINLKRKRGILEIGPLSGKKYY